MTKHSVTIKLWREKIVIMKNLCPPKNGTKVFFLKIGYKDNSSNSDMNNIDSINSDSSNSDTSNSDNSDSSNSDSDNKDGSNNDSSNSNSSNSGISNIYSIISDRSNSD